MSVNSKAKSMLVRGIKAEQDLNRIFAKRVLAENEDLQDLLAEHYIEECSPSIGKHLRGVVVYVDPSDSPSYYGVQLDDENNTLVYCRKNGVNIGAFLDSIAQMTGETLLENHKEHGTTKTEYLERRSELAKEYLLWKPQKGCEVQVLIVGRDDEVGIYFGVLELDTSRL